MIFIHFKKAWKDTIQAVKTHKLLVIVIFLLQFLFIVSIAYINVTYQSAISRNIQSVVMPLQDANYDENAIRSGIPFLEDAGTIYDNYTRLVANLKKLVVYQILAFLSINLWCWAVTQYLFRKGNVLKLWVTEVLRAIILTIPLLVIDYALLTVAINQAVADTGSLAMAPIYAAATITVIASYFLVVALALPSYPIKETIKRAFIIGTKKIHYLLATLLINAAVVSALGYFGVLSVEWPFWAMAVFVMLFVLGFVCARIFFVAVVRELDTQY